jgi:hypothetical protein
LEVRFKPRNAATGDGPQLEASSATTDITATG